MVLVACTGTGLALLVIDRSAEPATCTLAEALLLPELGSVVVEPMDPVCVMVEPAATVALTFTT